MRVYVFKDICLSAVIISRGRRNMILSASRWLLTAVICFVPYCLAASPDASQTAMSPSSTFESVPRCASNCIKEFIDTQYPEKECTNRQDLNCLCKTHTKNGYTLGEAALQCSFSVCPMEVALNWASYAICDSVPGALRGTHGTLTATVVPPSKTTKTIQRTTTVSFDPSTENSTRSTPESTLTTTASFETPISATSTRQDPPSSIPSSTDEDTASPSASATQPAYSGSRLNAGAVIGVSVASGVAGFFILGVLVFFCCRRMKRRRQDPKDRGSFFEIGGLMSEPSNFSLPTRRPSPGPYSSSHAVDLHPESPRPSSPPQPMAQNPAVVITRPYPDYYDNHRGGVDRLSKPGFAFSTPSDFAGSSAQSSPRTVSDLLPDKPGLYPEPLRWSQHNKSSRPVSGETLFEEDATRPRSFLGASSNHTNFSNPPYRYHEEQRYDRKPVVGLPVNPRAMLYGFRGANTGRNLVPQGPGYQRKPVFANAGEKLQPPRQADFCGKLPPQGYVADQDRPANKYWGDPNGGPSLSPASSSSRRSSRSAPRRSFHAAEQHRGGIDCVEDNFETIDINENSGWTPRHSGSFRPLTPVREVRTPLNGAQRPDYFNDNASVKYPRMPVSGTVSPKREIISRPRIVRQDDIKRVHIRRGKPSFNTSAVPYSPDDYWLGRSRGSPSMNMQPQGPRRFRVRPQYPP